MSKKKTRTRSRSQSVRPPSLAVGPNNGSQPRKPGGPVAPEVRTHALTMLVSGMRPGDVARSVGVTTESLRLWRRHAEREGTLPAPPVASEKPPALPAPPSMPQRAPHDNASGLGADEVAAILELKRRHPSMGPAQIRTQLKRFKGWRLAVRAIARVLTRNGYELVHTASRPKGDEEPRRWEAPRRNAIWQMDFAELQVGPEHVSLLLVEDDFSRFVVAHALLTEATSDEVVRVLQEAIRRHGKPESVYTDRGGAFLAFRDTTSLQTFLEDELVDHHVGRAYRPQGRGKIESVVHTVRRELWDLVHFESAEDARGALGRFFDDYNHRRAHMGIDGLTPADRFFGRWEAVRDRVEAASRRRQGALVASGNGRDPFVTEEALPHGAAEVLRLCVFEGRMELRFLGHRVDLGGVKP